MTDQTSGIAQDIEIPTCNTCGSPRDWRRHIVGGNDLYQIHKDDGTLAGYGCERTTQAPPDRPRGYGNIMAMNYSQTQKWRDIARSRVWLSVPSLNLKAAGT